MTLFVLVCPPSGYLGTVNYCRENANDYPWGSPSQRFSEKVAAQTGY